MIKKYGDVHSINVVDEPKKVIKKSNEDMQQQILKFQEEKEEGTKNKTER